MKNLVSMIWKDERGQDMVEYALMVGFIAVAAAAVAPGLTTGVQNMFSRVSGLLDSSGPPAGGSGS